MESMESVQYYVNACKRKRNVNKSAEIINNESLQTNWKFRVLAPDLHKFETVCVAGDCLQLGFWKAKEVIKLTQESGTNYWSSTIRVPLDRDIHFRYCVCIVSSNPKSVIIRKWESNLKPRLIKRNSEYNDQDFAIFGKVGDSVKIENGWLSDGNVTQFHLFDDMLQFNRNNFENVFVKLTTANYNSDNDSIDDSEDVETKNVIVEVAKINISDSTIKTQEDYGIEYNKGDYVVFNVMSLNEKYYSYVLEFYNKDPNFLDHPTKIGYSNIIKSAIETSRGSLKLSIISSAFNKPIGVLRVNYVVVESLDGDHSDLKIGYSNYWKESWKGLEVGHRGMGNSFKVKDSGMFRENTLASFKKADESGADMVEFDVQLSVDNAAVLYHDFNCCLMPNKNDGSSYDKMIKLPMQNLNFEQLKNVRIYHVKEAENGIYSFNEDAPESFPLLSAALTDINQNLGFNIEIKYPLINEKGETELQHPLDLNTYLDTILRVVFKNAENRVIMFSCFHPDICTALRLKQNFYPVFFLTHGVRKNHVRAQDQRCNSVSSAVQFARSANLLGIVTNSEDLLRDTKQIQLVHNSGLVHFCWGEDNNNKEVIDDFKRWGLHGIIFDKIDVYSTKPRKKSIFEEENASFGRSFD